VDRAIDAAGLPAAVALLLFDELWVECEPGAAAAVAALVRAEMATAGLGLGVNVPVRIDPDPGPPRFSWEQLELWRWGPVADDDTPPIEVPRDWRSVVAGWPHDRWVRWRARSGEIQSDLGRAPTADDIREEDGRPPPSCWPRGSPSSPPPPTGSRYKHERPPARPGDAARGDPGRHPGNGQGESACWPACHTRLSEPPPDA